MDNMTIAEKVSYIKGLVEGMKLDTASDEGKVLSAIIDVLGDIAINIEDIDSDLEDVANVVADLESDVCDLEDDVYGDDNDYVSDEIDDEELYEITCPNCGGTITADFEVASSGEINCPNCGETLVFDLSSLDEEEPEQF